MKAAKLLQTIGVFSIYWVVNPGGSDAFRASGSVKGQQRRKQFKNEADAIAWAGAQAKAKMLAEVAPEVAVQILPPREQFEAKEIYGALRTRFPDTTLREVLEFYLQHHQSVSMVALGRALADYADERERELKDQALSVAQSRRLAQELNRFGRTMGAETMINRLSAPQVLAYLRRENATAEGAAPKYSNKTYNNRRGYLMHFFRWCVQRQYLAANPLAGTKPFRKRRARTNDGQPSIQIISAAQAAKLMNYVEHHYEARLVPYVALCLFAGIRPGWKVQEGEISRFNPSFVALDDGLIRMPDWATKTGKPRDVSIRPNLRAWLKKYPLSSYPILCRNFRKRLKHLRELFHLGHDVLRHTFITMLVTDTRSIGDAALQAGNTENILWGSYLRLGVTKTEARAFWAIRPTRRWTHIPPSPSV
jgi:integrase